MAKPIFKTSDARNTAAKVESLISELREVCEKLERVKVEVELLFDANVAMSKTIKKSRYAE